MEAGDMGQDAGGRREERMQEAGGRRGCRRQEVGVRMQEGGGRREREEGGWRR